MAQDGMGHALMAGKHPHPVQARKGSLWIGGLCDSPASASRGRAASGSCHVTEGHVTRLSVLHVALYQAQSPRGANSGPEWGHRVYSHSPCPN